MISHNEMNELEAKVDARLSLIPRKHTSDAKIERCAICGEIGIKLYSFRPNEFVCSMCGQELYS